MKHKIIPIIVGSKIENKVHFKLPVSFFIVRHVVEQGKWHNEKTNIQIAVVTVQPLSIKICLKLSKLENSTIFPVVI